MAVNGVICTAVQVAITVSYLISAKSVSVSSLIRASFGVVVFIVAMLVVCVPIATVAEVFEYDVFRALNSPAVVRSSQRYFGQQFLSHLKNLEWGLRCGGTVINMRLVMNVLLGLLITLATAVSQAVLNQANEKMSRA